jgi:hypothetical protein
MSFLQFQNLVAVAIGRITSYREPLDRQFESDRNRRYSGIVDTLHPSATWVEFVPLFAIRGFQPEEDECFELTHPLQIQLVDRSFREGMPKLWRASHQTAGIVKLWFERLSTNQLFGYPP